MEKLKISLYVESKIWFPISLQLLKMKVIIFWRLNLTYIYFFICSDLSEQITVCVCVCLAKCKIEHLNWEMTTCDSR